MEAGSYDIDAHDSMILDESGVKANQIQNPTIRVGHQQAHNATKAKTPRAVEPKIPYARPKLSALFENGLAAAIKK